MRQKFYAGSSLTDHDSCFRRCKSFYITVFYTNVECIYTSHEVLDFFSPVPKPDNELRLGLRFAAGATMKYVVYKHIALITKVILAILTSIAIKRTHSFTYVRRRRSLKRQCTRETIRVGPNDFLSGHPTNKKRGGPSLRFFCETWGTTYTVE